MSRAILIMGESGSGKTTSCRTLNPNETYFIDCDGKGLSWRGWKKQYNKEAKNYSTTSEQEKILTLMQAISDKKPEVKHIVIDTLNGIMIDDEFRRMKEKSYDKWQDLAAAVYAIAKTASALRDDLTVICTIHSQVDRDDNGYMYTRAKTSGKKLDKIALESKFTTVLLAKANDGNYVFETQANKSTAKSPMGCFEKEIPNDMNAVIQRLRDYEEAA